MRVGHVVKWCLLKLDGYPLALRERPENPPHPSYSSLSPPQTLATADLLPSLKLACSRMACRYNRMLPFQTGFFHFITCI